MAQKQRRPAGTNRRAPKSTKSTPKVTCLPTAVTRYLESLASICLASAKTKDRQVATLAITLINKAPGELNLLLDGLT
jgi:hypothetical protein